MRALDRARVELDGRFARKNQSWKSVSRQRNDPAEPTVIPKM
jgi:hypothetical protein